MTQEITNETENLEKEVSEKEEAEKKEQTACDCHHQGESLVDEVAQALDQALDLPPTDL